jgi:hypothetical protein
MNIMIARIALIRMNGAESNDIQRHTGTLVR